MRKRLIGAVLAAVLMVGVMPGAVQAKPLDVDCDLLSAVDDGVFGFLAGTPIRFENLGDLISTMHNDDAVFGDLVALGAALSGGEIVFTSPEQVVNTHAKCHLNTKIIGLVRWLADQPVP